MLSLNSFPIPRGSTSSTAHIWAIGGGKGGVGKSFVSSGLALFLAHQGYRTILIDLDLGAANLHSYLGVPRISKSLQEVIYDKSYNLEKILLDTHHPNLKLISSHSDQLNTTNLTLEDKSHLLSAIYNLKADYVLLDLSAGIHETTLDLFNAAEKHIIVTTPEPISIENAYTFMKEAFYRKLKRLEQQFSLDELISELMSDPVKYGIKSPADLLYVLSQKDPERGAQLMNIMSTYEFHILTNQTRSLKDRDLGSSIKSVCHKYFGIQSTYVGNLDYDNGVWQALRNRKHLLMQNPHSPLYGQFLSMTRLLVDPMTFRKVI